MQLAFISLIDIGQKISFNQACGLGCLFELVLGWRCPQLQHCCQIQHFITNQKIVILDKFLVVYNMLDLATILQLQTAPPQNTAVKAELTKIANCELRN